MNRSRLSRRIEQKTKKNLLLSILGIILVLLLVFKFGLPLLINLSLFLSGGKGDAQLENKNPSFIAPPILNSLPLATSSASIIISGVASKDQTIKLYINDDLINTAKAQDDGSFSFKETIKPGENFIKAKAAVDDKDSEFSDTIIAVYKNAPPSLNLNSPTDAQSFSKDQNLVEVKGTTDSEVRVTVNGFWAITDDSGEFSYRLLLQNGENKIKIIATDLAGNKTEKEIKVTYNP